MYPYRRLDSSRREIRILQWVSNEDENDDRVRCKIVHISLDDSPEYDALSYTWGAPEPSQTIIVDGIEVSVGPNLFVALKQIRHADRPLWVDSLCINQGDQQERTDQVCLMGDIYKKADIVIIWLGDDEDDGDAALVFLENFQEQLSTPGGMANAMMSDREFDEAWNAVGKLFQRPYWSRVWIIQEVLLGDNPVVCCGAASCSWGFIQLILCIIDIRAIAKLSAAAKEALLFPSTDLARTLARLYDQRYEGRKMSLVDCFALGRQRKATDPRDHIYGMLNLVEAPGIVPDYTISVETLYGSVARCIIEQDKNLDLLSACVNKTVEEVQALTNGEEIFLCVKDASVDPSTNPDATAIEALTELFSTVIVNESKMPSWVPDWRVWTDDANFMFLAKKEKCQYRASKETLAKTHFDEKGSNILTVEGFILDEVLAVSPRESIHDNDGGSEIPALVMEDWAIWESVKPDDCPYGDLSEQELVFERTLFLGRDYGNLKKPTMSKMLIKMAAEDEEGYAEANSDTFLQDYFADDLNDGQRGAMIRRFAVTKKGYMGRAPLSVQEGDIVAILFGAKVPFMLRRFENHYILLGECYIHGVMDGEAIDALDKGMYNVQEFHLE